MSGKFSLQWINDRDQAFQLPMGSVRFNLREPLGTGMSTTLGGGGLGGARLHLDQVHIQFRPTTDIALGEFRPGDDDKKDWRAETQALYVRCTPGERYPLLTRMVPSSLPFEERVHQNPSRFASHSLTFSAALNVVPFTGLPDEDVWCRTYRPVRDLPVVAELGSCSEIQLDLLWPLLQGDPAHTTWWTVPDYRILRVICDFSYT